MYLDIQIIDTSNCHPVIAVYLDIWHCNATGVYSGIVASGNGDSGDFSNLNNTSLRGLQKTDKTGIVGFETIFPGHYLGKTRGLSYTASLLTLTGRANHIHVLVHNPNSTAWVENYTISGNVASHVGQIFFDQSLQAEVEANEPYTSNMQALTPNSEDVVLATEANASDPMMRYVFLGKNVTDGILGWVRIGIDPTATHTASAGATYYNGGGVQAGVSGVLGV